MSPSHPFLPPGVSPEMALLGLLAVVIIALAIVGGTLRLATQWVAGFKPPWGRTILAMLCSTILSLVSYGLLFNVIGKTAGTPDPRIVLLVLPVGFLAQTVSYKAFLAGDRTEEVSLPQAALIGIVQRVIFILGIMAIAIVLFFLVGSAAISQAWAKHGGASLPTGWRSPAAPANPAFATVADAQREAVRRYPLLGIKGSRMNQAYVDRYRLYQKTNPDFFQNTRWPVELADEIADDPAAR